MGSVPKGEVCGHDTRWLWKQWANVNACSLHDLDRKPRPVAAADRQLIENFGRISLMAHAETFVLTDAAAHLKINA